MGNWETACGKCGGELFSARNTFFRAVCVCQVNGSAAGYDRDEKKCNFIPRGIYSGGKEAYV